MTAEYQIKSNQVFINRQPFDKTSAFTVSMGETTLKNQMMIACVALFIIAGIVMLLIPIIRYLIERTSKEKKRITDLEREVAELKASKKDDE